MNCWTVVVWINVMFLSAVWTLILTAPIHCRAYDVMLHFSKSVLLKKLIPILSGRRMSTFWANVPLSHIQPLLSDGKRQHHQLHTYISDTQDPFCPVLCQRFTFAFVHLADAFIPSDTQQRENKSFIIKQPKTLAMAPAWISRVNQKSIKVKLQKDKDFNRKSAFIYGYE